MKIILTPEDDPHNFCSGEGETIAAAIKDFLKSAEFSYGVEVLSCVGIYEGLVKLIEGETTFKHWDFSVPEEAFTLSLVD